MVEPVEAHAHAGGRAGSKRRAARRISPAVLHPVSLQVILWVSILILYLMRVSDWIEFPAKLAIEGTAVIVAPFCLAAACVHTGMHLWGWKARSAGASEGEVAITRWTLLLIFWVLACGVEIIYSRGLPIFWLVLHIGRSYADFGIHTLHGLLDSLIAALALVSLDQYLVKRKAGFLWTGALAIVWTIAIINRALLMQVLLEAAFLYLLRRRIRIQSVLLLLVAGIGVIILFGIVGDARTGHAIFYLNARPAVGYPDWLPSGFLWVYTYAVTPFNNLLYNTLVRLPYHDWHLYNTWSTLIPSALNGLFDPSRYVVYPALVTGHFNTSTGYVQIYQDMGWPGITAYSAILGVVCEFYWLGRSRRAVAAYAVVAALLLLMIFTDVFLELPYITQLFWIWFLYRQPRKQRAPDGVGWEQGAEGGLV